jgi:hypothetical protein
VFAWRRSRAQPISGGAVNWIGLLCALLPALPAILVGIRAYSEFELLADQSAAMQHVMADASEQMDTLEKLDFDRPLASRELGAALFNVTMTMLLDVKGWAQLFRAKAVDSRYQLPEH